LEKAQWITAANGCGTKREYPPLAADCLAAPGGFPITSYRGDLADLVVCQGGLVADLYPYGGDETSI
jgi:hypothetical protein